MTGMIFPLPEARRVTHFFSSEWEASVCKCRSALRHPPRRHGPARSGRSVGIHSASSIHIRASATAAIGKIAPRVAMTACCICSLGRPFFRARRACPLNALSIRLVAKHASRMSSSVSCDSGPADNALDLSPRNACPTSGATDVRYSLSDFFVKSDNYPSFLVSCTLIK